MGYDEKDEFKGIKMKEDVIKGDGDNEDDEDHKSIK